ncbi:MAG: hypothetical protein IPP14_15620 [Planctomycetes bacterium]|nr:hypothetical protein [Planctomycetota bacterium]
MSTLKRALERSKAAWEAVGKPKRARAHCKRLGVTINQYTSNITASEVLATDWRAIVPKAKYEPVGTVPVVGDVVVDTDSVSKTPKAVLEIMDDGFAVTEHMEGSDEGYRASRFSETPLGVRVLKRKVPKKAEDAGWPRYELSPCENVLRAFSAAKASIRCDKYAQKVEHDSLAFTAGHDGYTEATAHEAAEWLYEHGFTEAAYKIAPMWEPKCIAYAGDWMMRDGVPVQTSGAAPGLRTVGILRRSRARRDAIAEIEGKLKALGDVK